MHFDFGYGNSSNEQEAQTPDVKTDLTDGQKNGDTTDLTNNLVAPDTDDDKSSIDENKTNESSNSDSDRQHDFVEGTTIEIEDNTYTVDNKGNLVDDKGNVFKQASEVKDFINQFNVEDDKDKDNTLSLANIQKQLGIEIVDDNDKPVEFENTPEGVASYVESVLEQHQEEYAVAGINKLFETYPFVQDMINYYVANGNSLEGYNEIKDRSSIQLDSNNEAQQEAIIREAFRENGMRGDVESYIQYLKDSGILFDTAQKELEGLVAKDNAAREQVAKEAEALRLQQEQETANYWNGVYEAIKTRKIAGYEIPETIIIAKDGKKIAATPNDFFNYVYQVDENGNSRYVNDLAKTTPEQRRDDELLRAYLRFTGGSYADLVNMAIKKEEVKTLRLRANQNNKKGIRINTPASAKPSRDETFGY